MIPRSDRFRIVPLGRGVWAALGNRELGVPSNAGIIDLETSVLVIDTLPTLQAAKELRTAARVLTGRDPGAVVNTHWHFDHWLGNLLFADCEIFGTKSTRDRILEVGPPLLSRLQGEEAQRAQEELDDRWEREERPLYKEELTMERQARLDLYEMSRTLQVVAPNQNFATRYRPPARRSVWFVEVSGHTESDTMVFLPDCEVLFAGDIVTHGVHPNLDSGRPEAWEKALRGIEKIAPKSVVPGHGAPGDLRTVSEMHEYLGELTRAARAIQPERIPDRFKDWLSPANFEVNVRRVREAPPSL